MDGWMVVAMIEVGIILVYHCRLSFYKGYFDQKQRNILLRGK